MSHEEQIKIMVCDEKFNRKPEGLAIGRIQNNLKETETTLRELAELLVQGASFRPGVLEGGRGKTNWTQQTVFGLDFDHAKSIDETFEHAKKLGVRPAFGYETFRSTEAEPRFRMIFCCDTTVTDLQTRDTIQQYLLEQFPEADQACSNCDRLFFGGKNAVLHPDYFARLDVQHILDTYQPKTVVKSVQKMVPKHRAVKKQFDNADAIATLDVQLLRKRLGLADVEGDKGNTNNTSLYYKYTLYPERHIFESEADLFTFINNIDLNDYLGVPNGKFRCIFPDHVDDNPSANICVADSGMPLYKCFGCNRVRTIISVTEQLARCSRRKAIEFLKAVYQVDYKSSEWVLEQRQILIDSALYLDTEEFRVTFPSLYRTIRTRKGILQSILLNATQFITESMQIAGKPIFYISYRRIGELIDTQNRNKISQSLILFALLRLLPKTALNEIPDEERKKAELISRELNVPKHCNFFSAQEFGLVTLEESERRAKKLIDDQMTLKALSRDYVYRTYGQAVANEVFPQYELENKRGTSQKADELTLKISEYVLSRIAENGYMLEQEVNLDNKIGRQWKKSIAEILQTYNLERRKLNKDLKAAYGISCRGYPYAILKIA